MSLHVSDWKARQARCARAVFGDVLSHYAPTREGWTLYWRHARISRAASVLRSPKSRARIISAPYMPRAPWPTWGWGDTANQASWRAGEFRYRLMLAAAVKLRGGHANADGLIRKADHAFGLGYLR